MLDYFMRHKKVSKRLKGVFRARKKFQKIGYSALGHRGALFSNIGLILSKTQLTSDLPSKVRIERIEMNGSTFLNLRILFLLLISKTQFRI